MGAYQHIESEVYLHLNAEFTLAAMQITLFTEVHNMDTLPRTIHLLRQTVYSLVELRQAFRSKIFTTRQHVGYHGSMHLPPAR